MTRVVHLVLKTARSMLDTRTVTLQLAPLVQDRTYNELRLSVLLSSIISSGPLVLSASLWRGGRTTLLPNVVVIHYCIVLGFSDDLSSLVVPKIHVRTDMTSWVWVLSSVNWKGLRDTSQCVGMSGAIYMVNRQGQLLQEEPAGRGQTTILTTHSTPPFVMCCMCIHFVTYALE